LQKSADVPSCTKRIATRCRGLSRRAVESIEVTGAGAIADERIVRYEDQAADVYAASLSPSRRMGATRIRAKTADGAVLSDDVVTDRVGAVGIDSSSLGIAAGRSRRALRAHREISGDDVASNACGIAGMREDSAAPRRAAGSTPPSDRETLDQRVAAVAIEDENALI
jgi:hypothetical protein